METEEIGAVAVLRPELIDRRTAVQIVILLIRDGAIRTENVTRDAAVPRPGPPIHHPLRLRIRRLLRRVRAGIPVAVEVEDRAAEGPQVRVRAAVNNR